MCFCYVLVWLSVWCVVCVVALVCCLVGLVCAVLLCFVRAVCWCILFCVVDLFLHYLNLFFMFVWYSVSFSNVNVLFCIVWLCVLFFVCLTCVVCLV